MVKLSFMFFNGLLILEKGYRTELIQFSRVDGSLIAVLRFWDFILSASLDIMFLLVLLYLYLHLLLTALFRFLRGINSNIFPAKCEFFGVLLIPLTFITIFLVILVNVLTI